MTRQRFFGAVVVSALLVAHVPSTAKAQQPQATIRQSIRFTSISDHCIDEFDEENIIYINEGDKVCKLGVQVRGRGKVKSKVQLQYLDEEDGWVTADYKTLTTNSSGKATFVLTTKFPTEPDDFCYEGESYTHRIVISRNGKFKSFRSTNFEVVYTSSDTNPACYYDYDDSYDYDYD